MEIISILEKNAAKRKNPAAAADENADKLRLYLLNRGFFIQTDKKVFSGGKYYDIIKADTTARGDNLSELDILFGKTNIAEKDQIFRDFLVKEKQRLEKIGKKSAESADRLNKTVYLLDTLYKL